MRNVRAKAGSKNAGGTISIRGGTIKLNGGKTVTAKGVGTGQASSISFMQPSSRQLTLDCAQLSANGGCSGYAYGFISIGSPAKISAVGTKINALRLMGANRGQIIISGTNDTITLDQAILNANGGKATNDGGNGGTTSSFFKLDQDADAQGIPLPNRCHSFRLVGFLHLSYNGAAKPRHRVDNQPVIDQSSGSKDYDDKAISFIKSAGPYCKDNSLQNTFYIRFPVLQVR